MRCKFCNSRNTKPIEDNNTEFDFQCNDCGNRLVSRSNSKTEKPIEYEHDSPVNKDPATRSWQDYTKRERYVLDRASAGDQDYYEEANKIFGYETYSESEDLR